MWAYHIYSNKRMQIKVTSCIVIDSQASETLVRTLWLSDESVVFVAAAMLSRTSS